MILLALDHEKSVHEMKRTLDKHLLSYQILSPTDPDWLAKLHTLAKDATIILTSLRFGEFDTSSWLHILTSLNRKSQSFLWVKEDLDPVTAIMVTGSSLPWIKTHDAGNVIPEIMRILPLKPGVGKDHQFMNCNKETCGHILKQQGSLSVLSFDCKAFESVAVNYGEDAYEELLVLFEDALMSLWGAAGNFRQTDKLCRDPIHEGMFYILLEPSRMMTKTPPPGILESLADRVSRNLTKTLWEKILQTSNRSWTSSIKSLPTFCIGYGTVLDNPAMKVWSLIDQLLETCQKNAYLQNERRQGQQKELVQAMIKTPGILSPHYQAIFQLQDLDFNPSIKDHRTLSMMKDQIFGFESLIRVNQTLCLGLLPKIGPLSVDVRYLNPDLLFSLAASVQLSLELDQMCLQEAVKFSTDLPGKLLVNILPRNLYYFDYIKPHLGTLPKLIFEVSESEVISNLDLLLQVTKKLREDHFEVAIDDFGKGYAGLDRLITVKPSIIKLDRALIQDIHEHPMKQALVSGVVQAAHLTQTLVLAEGVEIFEELSCLKDLNIDLVQGFLLHRPEDKLSITKALAQAPALLHAS